MRLVKLVVVFYESNNYTQKHIIFCPKPQPITKPKQISRTTYLSLTKCLADGTPGRTGNNYPWYRGSVNGKVLPVPKGKAGNMQSVGQGEVRSGM